MGKYDESLGRELDNSDVQHDVNNGNLWQSSTDPNTYYDGDGVEYDENYNPKYQ